MTVTSLQQTKRDLGQLKENPERALHRRDRRAKLPNSVGALVVQLNKQTKKLLCFQRASQDGKFDGRQFGKKVSQLTKYKDGRVWQWYPGL